MEVSALILSIVQKVFHRERALHLKSLVRESKIKILKHKTLINNNNV